MAVTTLIPFTEFPQCVYSCGHLYDANGACVPPGHASAPAYVYTDCFCADSRVNAFSTGTAGVCGTVCDGTTSALESLQSWFLSVCSVTPTTSSSSTSATSTISYSSGSKHKVYGSWIEGNWRWVVAIVVVFVLIVGSWIGACIWRRSYLRKKDRMYELGKGIPTNSGVNNFVSSEATYPTTVPKPSSVEKFKKWTVRERT